MRTLCLLFLTVILAPLALAETRVFVSLAGTLLEAEITAVAGDSVTLRRVNDEQSLVVNRKTLCKEDNAYILGWMEKNPDKSIAPTTTSAPAPVQKYSLACQTLPSKSNRGPPDGGERVIELSYNFNLSNREVQRDLQNATGLAITLGKNTGDSGNDLIVLQKEVFEVSIRPQSKMVHSTTPIRLTYSQGIGTPYGVKNYGYVLIIRDSAGNVLFVEASPDANAKFTKELIALEQVPCIVDRDFKLKPDSQVPTSYISF
ncbi:hypothetical protein [Prosthecobacter sp.]|uniref:hypothetical protein n=1 Tax=Prosthecobacter sp. TaxID=1965333 RepID=UPI002ABB91BF|nr:hypothetical protein [Prosthecobacter sp.]MDZ4405252.1 hypothetical protein [Prosthecobacter sp.]